MSAAVTTPRAERAPARAEDVDDRAAGTETHTEDVVGTHRWAPRRLSGFLVRALAVGIPIVAATVSGIALATALPAPDGAIGRLLWYVLILAASMVVLVVVDRAARRLLPLSVLLRLSLSFPDEAPSRLSVAMRSGSKRALAARIEDIRAHGGNPFSAEEIVLLGTALNAHDRRTRGHSERVRAYTDLVAEELRLSPEDADRLRWAAFLHDIGKLAVPAKVLNKAGKLDDREWHLLRQHPHDGEEFAARLHAWLGDWMHGIGQHHERFDGTGYPDGLAADQISFAGRIVAVTDAFETMTAVRSYNRPKSQVEARRELRVCAGTHFDPIVVRAFMNISIRRLRWTAGLAALLAQIPFLGVPMRAGAQMATSAAAAQSSSGMVAGSLLMSAAGVATPITLGATAAAASLAAPPAVTASSTVPTVPVGSSPVTDDASLAPADDAAAPHTGAEDTLTDGTDSVESGESGESDAPEWSHAGGNDKAPETSNSGGQGKSNAGGNGNSGGGNPNAGGGNPNAGGGNPNARGGNPNAGGGKPEG